MWTVYQDQGPVYYVHCIYVLQHICVLVLCRPMSQYNRISMCIVITIKTASIDFFYLVNSYIGNSNREKDKLSSDLIRGFASCQFGVLLDIKAQALSPHFYPPVEKLPQMQWLILQVILSISDFDQEIIPGTCSQVMEFSPGVLEHHIVSSTGDIGPQ